MVKSSTGTITSLSILVLSLFASCVRNTPEQPEQQVPSVVSTERAETPPGKITIVEFVDFECPFCRAMNADLSPILDAHRDRVRVVRKQVPLIAVHPHALAAARASVCADEMGGGDAMAQALFRAPLSDLTDGGCMAMAARLGLDADRFTTCFDDESTIRRIKSDVLQFEASSGRGVPTVWVDGHVLAGQHDAATMRAAVEDALRRD